MKRMIPARFEKLAMEFDDISNLKPCESSGSEHSPDSSFTDLSDLVNSFIEDNSVDKIEEQDQSNQLESDKLCLDIETRNELQSLMSYANDSDESRKTIKNEVEMAVGFDGLNIDKRKLITRLRENGLNAGICKSKWKKTDRIPAGEFEYIDILINNNTRYIIELNLTAQFQIAKQTKDYTALLDIFPNIYIAKVDEMKRVVRIMCAAIKVSLKSFDMPVAPWRRNGYMQVKWFGSYKRTTNDVVSCKVRVQSALENNETRSRFLGFVFEASESRKVEFGCGNEGRIERKSRAKFGHLAAALAG